MSTVPPTMKVGSLYRLSKVKVYGVEFCLPLFGETSSGAKGSDLCLSCNTDISVALLMIMLINA